MTRRETDLAAEPLPQAPSSSNDAPRTNSPAGMLFTVGEPGSATSVSVSVGCGLVRLPNPAPANDGDRDEAELLLAADPEFARVCAARRAAWIESMETDAQAAAASVADEGKQS